MKILNKLILLSVFLLLIPLVNALPTTTIPESCSDTDGGNYPLVLGNVFGYKNNAYYNYHDVCYDILTLKEYNCTGTQWSYYNYTCSKYGSGYFCLDGKCVQTTMTTNPDYCSDTDGGFNPKIIGTVSGYKNGVYYSYKDNCVNSIVLNEYSCSSAQWTVTSFKCYNYPGYECSNGKCLKIGGGGGCGFGCYLLDITSILRGFINKILSR